MFMDTQATLNGKVWPVSVTPLEGLGNYLASGRGTGMWVAVRPSLGICGGRYLIAVTNLNCCGCLDAGQWSAEDIQQHLGVRNKVDAATLAAALEVIFEDVRAMGI